MPHAHRLANAARRRGICSASDQQAGVNGHISKPIEIPTLLKTLEGVLE